jgi:hypothetical protein
MTYLVALLLYMKVSLAFPVYLYLSLRDHKAVTCFITCTLKQLSQTACCLEALGGSSFILLVSIAKLGFVFF